MEIAALSEIRPEASGKNHSPLLVESQLFAQLIDQYSVSQQNTLGESDFADRPVEDREDNRFDHRDEEGPTDNQENDTEHPGKTPLEAPGLAIALGILNGAQIPTPPPTPATAHSQLQIATPTKGATAALQQAVTSAGARPGHATLQGETPVADGKTKAMLALSDESLRMHRPGAQITADTNPQLRSQAPTTVTAAATSVQEAATTLREVAANETSLRAGRDEALARHPQQAAQHQPRVDQPKSAATNTAGTDQTAPAGRPNAGQAASPPQTPSAVSQGPTMVATPLVSLRSTGMPFAGDDLLKLDLAVERGTATQPSPAVQAKTATSKATTTAHARATPGQQVAMQIRQAAKAGVDHIRIQLQPADLGKVDVRLTIVEESVQLVVTVDRPETLEQLQRDSRQLLEALKDTGLQADNDSLTFQHRGSDGQGPDNGETGSQHTNSPGDGDKPTDQASSETVPNRAPRHDGLISIEA